MSLCSLYASLTNVKEFLNKFIKQKQKKNIQDILLPVSRFWSQSRSTQVASGCSECSTNLGTKATRFSCRCLGAWSNTRAIFCADWGHHLGSRQSYGIDPSRALYVLIINPNSSLDYSNHLVCKLGLFKTINAIKQNQKVHNLWYLHKITLGSSPMWRKLQLSYYLRS